MSYKMQSFSQLMGGSGINLGDLSKGIDFNKLANDNIGKISTAAKKVGIDIDIPKINIPDNGLTKTINDSVKEVSKTYDDSIAQVNDASNMDVNKMLKDSGVNTSGIDMSGIKFG